MCRVLRVQRSGYYAWLKRPLSDRALEDQRLLERIRGFYIASDGVYGSPRIFKDLREEVVQHEHAHRCSYDRPRRRHTYAATATARRVPLITADQHHD